MICSQNNSSFIGQFFKADFLVAKTVKEMAMFTSSHTSYVLSVISDGDGWIAMWI
jgi:hypothetical protein